MKPDHTRRAIGGAAVLFGLWLVWSIFYPFVRVFGTDASIDFLLTFLSMAIMGVLAVVFGIRLFRAMSVSSLKWVVGVFAVVSAFCLSSGLSGLFTEFLPERIRGEASGFLSSLVVILAYLFVVRGLLRHLTGEKRSATSLLSRWVLIVMAWQLWMLLSSVFEEYSPVKEGDALSHEPHWMILGSVVPIIVAFVLYQICAALLLPKVSEGAAE